jgi:hypothetical protein
MREIREFAPEVLESSNLVLVSDGGPGQARSTLAAVRALAVAGYSPAVTISGRGSLAASSAYCTRVVRTPRAGRPGYAQELRALMKRGYRTLLPASDAALIALEDPAAQLVDKTNLEKLAHEAGILTPPSHHFDSRAELLEVADELEYPVVVKPNVKRTISAGQSARRVASARELKTLSIQSPVIVQPYISDSLRAVCGVMYQGQLAAVVHQRYLRTWPIDCGTASAAETTTPDILLEERLARLLSNHNGIFQAQFAGRYLLDMNPRVYGSLPLAVKAGANLPAFLCDLQRGREIDLVRGREGVFYRWLEGDVRHAWSAVKRRDMKPLAAMKMLTPRRGGAHSTESLRDPKPMLQRIRHIVRSR